MTAALALAVFAPGAGAAQAVSGQFTTLATYHTDVGRDGYAPSENISASQAAGFHSQWTKSAGAAISDEPAVVNGVAYWGDWTGTEHATAANGKDLWTANLGTTTPPASNNCVPKEAGIASSATVATASGTRMLWTGTGNGGVAELNATTGKIQWETHVAPSNGGFVWSSPALYRGNVYIGVSSFGDCPLVRGEVVELNARNGSVLHTFYTVSPSNCGVGAGVWSSPAIDPSTNSLFITVGNACPKSPYGSAVLDLSASTLAVNSSWQVPVSQQVVDSDFGATPTLFSATLGGVSTPMVGAANKNGMFYAFKRSSLSAGPVWQSQVAVGGECPQCADGSVSPAAFDGHTLYVAGGRTTVSGTTCKGSVMAVDPASGKAAWQDCLTGGVLSPVSAIPGLVFVTDGSQIICVTSSSGTQVWTFSDSSGMPFYGGPVVTGRVLYAGNLGGKMYAFAPG
jgi:polyvinyl alcohol dehydrogenase (cytochrome)